MKHLKVANEQVRMMSENARRNDIRCGTSPRYTCSYVHVQVNELRMTCGYVVIEISLRRETGS